MGGSLSPWAASWEKSRPIYLLFASSTGGTIPPTGFPKKVCRGKCLRDPRKTAQMVASGAAVRSREMSGQWKRRGRGFEDQAGIFSGPNQVHRPEELRGRGNNPASIQHSDNAALTIGWQQTDHLILYPNFFPKGHSRIGDGGCSSGAQGPT